MKFVKLKHIHCTKLAKVEETFSYEDYEKLAKSKFEELQQADEVLFCDADGAILEKDVLVDYINSQLAGDKEIMLLVRKFRNNEQEAVSDGSTMSVISCGMVENWLTDCTTTNTSQESAIILPFTPAQVITQHQGNDYVFNEFAKPKNPLYMTVEEWRNVIIKQGGEDLFNIYEKEGLLPDPERKHLVRLTCAKLIELYGYKIPEFAKRNLAEAIILLFPNLRDPVGKFGYEAFYSNNNGGEGYISWRLRTLTRNYKNKGQDGNKRKSTESLEVSKSKAQKTAEGTASVCLTKEQVDAIEFLKNIPKTEIEAIRLKMALTYEYRRTLGVDIFKHFPRFLDVPSLIEDDYLTTNTKVNFSQKFANDIDKIFKIYKATVKQPNIDIIKVQDDLNSEPGWDSTIRAILAVMCMLPSCARGRNKKSELSGIQNDQKLFVFKKNNTPISEIVQTRTTKQPFLVAQGENKAAITQFNLIIDGHSLPCPHLATSTEAFEQLFMSHFVFNLEYDAVLKPFWEFFQTYYFEVDAEKVTYTPKMVELRTRLCN